MEKLLIAENVSKNFGDFTALNKVSIAVPKGCIFGLLGPNGAGKTTLIRIINQIMMPDSGTVHLDGGKLKQDHIRDIGYMPEERGLYKSMKVGEQVLYLAQLKGLTKTEAKERAKYWFDRLEISNWWGKKIEELSKGQAQKIQFVVTVMHNPKLLIFDEPFSGFDPINASLIKDEILKLRDDGATVIFSTHRMESVEEMCDHIALIHKSNKILDGGIRDIKREYKSNTFEIGINAFARRTEPFDLAQEPPVEGKAENITNESGKAALQNRISEKFKVTPAHFKSLEDELKLNITITNGESPNALLQYLMGQGEVTHFVELIPTMNDIFIKTVNAN